MVRSPPERLSHVSIASVVLAERKDKGLRSSTWIACETRLGSAIHEAESFAVATEAFFEKPRQMRKHTPVMPSPDVHRKASLPGRAPGTYR
jgi:hypothetical protein